MRPAGGLRPVDLGRRSDLSPVESLYEIILLQCSGHMRSTGYICFVAAE